MKKIVFIISTFCFVMIQGIRKELNPKKINLTEFTEAMQSCGTMLGFDREFKLHLFGSQEDYNKTLCLSFCALRKLKFYVIEDEIKKELAHVRNARLKEEVYKALDVCKHLLDDPCKLFDCFFDYAKVVDAENESLNLSKFFSEGSL
ncbi:uncharacterized protein LOC100116734 isoform X2 [Nasonia vitripennis]|uniref:Putative odorant binding protein 25 n=1 Tax=Nasonia vitripennis TaxID=7425 RepID=G8B1N0_NASVI|nr:uncharacterized protein LOC100116734 isoform X2 [Nasonia vitripennis]CCD17794.1 putative odorant binding protein 25 [Nasonia vitripennis]